MTIEYIAGFFDGESCININKNKVRMSASQTNEEVLNEIKEFFGFGTVSKLKKRKSHWKDAWAYYIVNNDTCLKALELLEPHLIVKKEKAKLAISVIKNRYSKLEERKKKIEEAVKMTNEGLSYREIERITGISRQTICINRK